MKSMPTSQPTNSLTGLLALVGRYQLGGLQMENIEFVANSDRERSQNEFGLMCLICDFQQKVE